MNHPTTQPTESTHTEHIEYHEPKSDKPGSMIGNKIKGIARIIYGAGEAVRGYSMSALDNTISSKARGANENGEITRRGQEEIERGLNDLNVKRRGSSNSGPATT
ncbi:hypothetical protein AGABI2DRAFT_195496 [Agaricus bisporus var. bisporus H97]|uniref:hypothetical protein n=1 Tax=Agaricus bisporus var. bisporus (strain H97 / ATCC MYA-4626 / FGSC 10389) TaxID=936046 RepID=UPI00029F7D24|nr:hypothetical protein AGABI2DRAFT_195496 [Agaricus bisporus var. bisporus H97]EKV42649.1 hypothetical protein AGABI2DRAFT_195496 [Agaricus bisporus var. bisporus H97]